MKNLVILGSTGSIGVNALDIVAAHPDKYRVVALTAGNNIDLLHEQIRAFRPEIVAVLSESQAKELRRRLGPQGPEVLSGVQGLVACATHGNADMVVSAIVGAAGLVPTMAAIEAGKDIALANKETLVCAGSLVMSRALEKEVRIFPVDSEHSAIFQSLEGHRKHDVRRLILTASGGPFCNRSLAELSHVTPGDALNHPNWEMGRKITIDSATMMNKGLEVIEAHWLFDLPAERLDVHIHPQSIVHSMVEYIDGSVIAQMGVPDMRTPIAYALSYPERLPLKIPALDLCELGTLTFEKPDTQKFSCLKLAYDALREGGSAPAVLNAANEVAVEAFLNGGISFLNISRIIASVLELPREDEIEHIDDVLRVDRWARTRARRVISEIS
ncbi:1-deoxy-D-xylulose-5-phosphate reductoisomerase [Geoalkalibacter subterraneus]|uniref:1-deoxy-D-xylulose 5-phosphate reductoisomerase n=1 Tax=Geoalkalibacter subterraneus TaxID=483547 RepID=A0A0B5FQQ3_9BACT|nr:1-deoxy-D-xylulose-5-phosphate reductoisomerase [Geoalkalibacter subterraneus]AJF06974.1 1-deoxy-D-xylulose 5-phosphate reductoisomerase [Geoalkalibacter subterraneus]